MVGTKKDSPVTADAAYAAPTPQVFYIHDDLSDYVRHTHGEQSVAFQLAQELLILVRRDPQRVTVLQLEDQITRLVGQGRHAPFAVTVGIGQAGERVARQLHQRTGWFPMIRRVDVTREEDSQGGYNLVSTTAQPLAEQLRGVETCLSLAVVDDTVFSGLTMRTVLRALPLAVLARTHAFCLRGVAESLRSIQALCPITIGFAAPGRILDEVSFINAAGLVRRISIRRVGQPSLAFFDRPEWMHAWFPGYADEVIAACRRLNALLEPDTPL
jgi:pyrimidine operon attenuation protein/uracil phosphoribosyltransferase